MEVGSSFPIFGFTPITAISSTASQDYFKKIELKQFSWQNSLSEELTEEEKREYLELKNLGVLHKKTGNFFQEIDADTDIILDDRLVNSLDSDSFERLLILIKKNHKPCLFQIYNLNRFGAEGINLIIKHGFFPGIVTSFFHDSTLNFGGEVTFTFNFADLSKQIPGILPRLKVQLDGTFILENYSYRLIELSINQ